MGMKQKLKPADFAISSSAIGQARGEAIGRTYTCQDLTWDEKGNDLI